LIAKFEIGMAISHKTSATIEYEWNSVDFTLTEWDTQDKIQYLNELDADFNNVSIETMLEMTK
jgi:hypothetical protein